jgi:hypothetical protein
MSKNAENAIKGAIAFAGTGLMCVGSAVPTTWYGILSLAVGAGILGWFGYHVLFDE